MQPLRHILILILAVLCIQSSAQASLAPGLYNNSPPVGQVAADNELTMPAGPAKGYVLAVHGGAWMWTGSWTLERDWSAWFNANGWGAYDIDYRPGWSALVDVVAAYDRLRASHPHAPICAFGASAGGQLVELLAASRPSLNCVISEAGIEDLTNTPQPLATIISGIFGQSAWQFSPVRLAGYITQPMLAAGSTYDPTVNEAYQLARMEAVRPQTWTMLLPGSDIRPYNFMHASVTPQALGQFKWAILQVLGYAQSYGPRAARARYNVRHGKHTTHHHRS